jgi:hypothetical protein
MILKNIMEKLRTALSLALPVLLGVLYYFMLSWRTAQSFIASRLVRLFKGDLNQMTSQSVDLMNFSSGTLLVILIKSIVKWVWKIVSWPFKKALEWMKSALPK